MLVLGMMSVMALTIRTPSIARAGQSWSVVVGGGVPGAWVVANTFQPRTIEIAVGDTVTWTSVQPWPLHTVTFLGDETPPPFDSLEGNQVVGTPRANFPTGSGSYDGTGYRNSGVMPRNPSLRRPYSLTFTKPGIYAYECLVHPGMEGKVIVRERVTSTPEEAKARGKRELEATLKAGTTAFMRATPERRSNAVTVPMLGDSKTGWSIFRFTSQPLVIERGTTVTWEMRDPLEEHTVTFTSGERVPPFTTFQPQPQGPPKALRNMRVWNRISGETYDGTGYVNSGVLFPPSVSGTPPTGAPGNPATSFSLTFTKPGRYEY
jgi:plastocyanin